MKLSLSLLYIALTSITLVSSHGVLTAVEGTNGVTAQGFGVVESTPRDGTRRRPFQVCFSLFSGVDHLTVLRIIARLFDYR
jgi:hypothetical protein